MGAADSLNRIPPQYTRRALTVDDVLRMVQAGVLDEDERVELLEGELIEMAPIGGAHMLTANRLNKTFVSAVGDAAVVSVQNNIALRPRSLPQPDLVLLRPEMLARPVVPGPQDILLVVEVADSTLAKDRDVKAPLYARHGIAELWIVDLEHRQVIVMRDPSGDGYRTQTVHGADETLTPLALSAVAIPLTNLFA